MTEAQATMPTDELVRYRVTEAKLLTKLSSVTHQLEAKLGGGGDQTPTLDEIDLDADPSAPFRIENALLLRKAWIHVVAVLKANEFSNLHSLAVQMRPALECAGQVVFIVHNTMIAPRLEMTPERAFSIVSDRHCVDYYRTVISATKDQAKHKEILDELSSATEKVTGKKPPRRKGRKSFTHEDKVKPLGGGPSWYNHLSEYFCHGRADWRGESWLGGVGSNNSALDELAFAGFMHYLAEQAAVMNAYAALCVSTDDRDRLMDAMLGHLHFVREKSKAARDTALSSFTWSATTTED